MIYTIGFTQSTAQHFFERLREHKIEQLIDIRLNNRSQLAGFAKVPDLVWLLDQLCGIAYVHDVSLAPTDAILDEYRKKRLDWAGYEEAFEALMRRRDIDAYIRKQYPQTQSTRVCLLCSEPTPEQCHRRLVAARFAAVFGECVEDL